VLSPSPEERADAALFARRVQAEIARAAGAAVSPLTLYDGDFAKRGPPPPPPALPAAADEERGGGSATSSPLPAAAAAGGGGAPAPAPAALPPAAAASPRGDDASPPPLPSLRGARSDSMRRALEEEVREHRRAYETRCDGCHSWSCRAGSLLLRRSTAEGARSTRARLASVIVAVPRTNARGRDERVDRTHSLLTAPPSSSSWLAIHSCTDLYLRLYRLCLYLYLYLHLYLYLYLYQCIHRRVVVARDTCVYVHLLYVYLYLLQCTHRHVVVLAVHVYMSTGVHTG